jgi:hypothetical protein
MRFRTPFLALFLLIAAFIVFLLLTSAPGESDRPSPPS